MKLSIPDAYKAMGDQDLIDNILEKKAELGPRLVILGHHYQRREIVELSDFKGDSFQLSRNAASQPDADFIIFCGVHFMAESAEILSGPHQTVQLPDLRAGCPMADMADIFQVEQTWRELDKVCGVEHFTPITYMNSTADLKAFCGRNVGAVCTSSNTSAVFDWAFKQADKILFFPDEHLGRNTAKKKGIPKEKMIVWDPNAELGGHTPKQIHNADIILWKGYCHVHTYFEPEHVKTVRDKYPDATVIVHPECTPPVIQLADEVFSTEGMCKYARTSSALEIIVGTEVGLLYRLQKENPEKKFYPASRQAICPNMKLITLEKILWLLENMNHLPQAKRGEVKYEVKVPEDIRTKAKKAVDRMLEVL